MSVNIQNDKNNVIIVKYSPRYLWFITLAYTMVTVTSNWFDARLINLFDITISPGTLIFPFTFLLSDIITEVYGYKHARRAILTAFLFNMLFIAYGQMVIHMPSPSFPTDNLMFNKLLSMDKRIIIASFISYFISEPVNSLIVAKMKTATKGQYMALRFIASTVLASALDSSFFTLIAFYGSMPNQNLVTMILSIWLVKMCIEILGIPLSTRISKIIKRKEQLDIYDEGTNFSLLKLDTQYNQSNNHFKHRN